MRDKPGKVDQGKNGQRTFIGSKREEWGETGGSKGLCDSIVQSRLSTWRNISAP
jgi:hypothetical protein